MATFSALLCLMLGPPQSSSWHVLHIRQGSKKPTCRPPAPTPVPACCRSSGSGSTLASLLPALLAQTVARDDLVRVVDLGPFKHRVGGRWFRSEETVVDLVPLMHCVGG
jgi:hypothetical protein